MLPSIKEVFSTVLEHDPTQVLKSIPRSHYTVTRRIGKMGADTEEQLCAILRDTPFTIQLDETTTLDNNDTWKQTRWADLEVRFRNHLDLDVPAWVGQPFQADVIHCDTGASHRAPV
ncbi:hypothetical protein DPEC_G00218920 [Dallia pectoralis]|uniref:Uncharacterized protein n=1 Tax=Dallia pectoralis TaxID=75939 RepID=A0ACC2G3J0_DALPE|nr:hypothetical protein DPEC_G00218920 [Dallia pectoralis]